MDYNVIQDYKKEFIDEIHKDYVRVEDLCRIIPKEVLAEETFLHEIFGDEIFIEQFVGKEVSGEKAIEKLDEDSILFDSEVMYLCDEVVDSDFDSKANSLKSQLLEE